MRNMTVRNITPELSKALEREKGQRGVSLNQMVLDLLRQGLGWRGRGPRSNGLAKLAGGWTHSELAEFEAATESFARVDEELWD